MIKRIIAAFCVVFAAAMILVGCAEKSPSVIVSANGEIMAELTQTTWGSVETTEDGYKSYVDAVIKETLDILCEQPSSQLLQNLPVQAMYPVLHLEIMLCAF